MSRKSKKRTGRTQERTAHTRITNTIKVMANKCFDEMATKGRSDVEAMFEIYEKYNKKYLEHIEFEQQHRKVYKGIKLNKFGFEKEVVLRLKINEKIYANSTRDSIFRDSIRSIWNWFLDLFKSDKTFKAPLEGTD